jgi:alpha-galactosidase
VSARSPAEPDAVFIEVGVPGTLREARAVGGGRWAGEGLEVGVRPLPDGAALLTVAGAEVARVVLRWRSPVPDSSLILGDAWERSYGDLQWRHRQPERPLPWYWLAHDVATGATQGMGVDVGPAALCAWTLDADGVTLWADVRNGGGPTRLGSRTLEVATVRAFAPGPGPWETLTGAARAMSTRAGGGARVPVGPVVGANNWYYAYGENFDEAAVLGDARTVVELADGHPVRPFSVIDDGWNPGGPASGGPWEAGTAGIFDDMAATAAAITEIGARPGLWFRPLLRREPGPGGGPSTLPGNWTLDPSRRDVLDLVAADLHRFRDWGYELVKHDFSTFDILGQFGPALGAAPASGPPLADTTRTTAEVVTDLYRVIRDAAEGLVVIGCNTIGHLAAGLVDVQRVGDDTSGRNWERTRRMGVNALAYRLPQHGSFFTVDADCVPSTPHTPWALNRQFLDVVARSGTALFVSVDPASRDAEVDADLSAALRIALDGGEPGGLEPVDWLTSTTPTRWRGRSGVREYDWSRPWGSDPVPA